MITFKCKMCGRDLIPIEGNTTVECKFCSTMQTIATADSEKKANLFNRANRLRMAAEFDKAAGVYESIVSEFPEEAEAYWGLCLCAYGIEYVDDPASGRKIPTCQRTLPESIMDSSNFEMACEYADGVARKLYREEAKAIDRLQRDILAIVANEEPYDVFICYKETDNSGNRTVDSVLGRDIYDALTAKGMKVFFARITLEDKLGQQYEPYIYAALHSAKVMLALGTSFEHFDAVWVKNEWSRFLDMASRDKTKTLIPCYKDIDAYDIPKEFRNLQAQDMNKLGWLQDLTFVVEKLCGKNKKGASSTETAVIQKTVPSELENLLKRGNLALENKQWKQALVFFDAALNLDAEYAIAYLGIACAKNECASKEDLMKKGFFGSNSVELSNVMRFADSKMKAWVEENLQSIEEKKQYLEKRRALQKEREKLLSRRFVYSSPVMGLKTDGTVVAAGKNEYGECNVSSWRNIAEIYWCGSTAYGLKIDGTVVAAGKNEYGECNVSGWRNIAEIYWRGSAVYGLKTDGTVVAAGENKYGQCNVSGWRNIAKIYPHGSAVYGLKTDGTVVAAGDNEYGQCNVSGWSNIAKIYPGSSIVYGLKTDGTVVAAGDNKDGQCNVGGWKNIAKIYPEYHTVYGLKTDGTVVVAGNSEHGQRNVRDWRNIAKIYPHGSTVYGLKTDGTVVAAGNNINGKCNVIGWRNIAEIYPGRSTVYGLKTDGTVVAAGDNEYGQCNVSGWRNIAKIYWDIYSVYGLKTDGTVVAAGKNEYGQCNVSDWRNIAEIYPYGTTVYGLKADGTFVLAGDIYEEKRSIVDWKLFNSIDTLEQEIEENNAIMRKHMEEEKQKALAEGKEHCERRIQELNCDLESVRRSVIEEEQNLQQYQSQLAKLRGLFTGKKRK